MTQTLNPVALSLLTLLLAGCVGPPALHESVLGYDQTTADLEQEILLLNIARLSQQSPVHFTVTGSIAATFDFTTSGDLGGNITSAPGLNDFDVSLSSSASENPTFSIIPISGQDFTNRIVSPFHEGAFAKLAYQGWRSLALIMRLMAESVVIEDRKGGRFIERMNNDAERPDEYKAFRRFAMHLEALQKQDQLFVNNLIFDQVILENLNEPWDQNPSDLATAVNDGFRWQLNNDGTYTILKRTLGRVLISNYDPYTLTDGELHALNEIANRRPDSFVMVDIRPGHPGGEIPLFGAIELRSYLKMLWTVSSGIGDQQQKLEFNVSPYPSSIGSIGDNPRKTLTINVSDSTSPDDVVHAHYKGRYYWVNESMWDWTAFRLLNILFQFTVADVSEVGIPITIAK